MEQTGQPYAYTGDDPVNAVDPLGLCSDSGGTFLVPGACDWTSKSWVSQTESTLQGQKGGGFSITNGLKAVADYGAAIGNVVTSTVTLGHVKISPPYCGFAWASDVGTGFGFVALAALTGGAGGAADVAGGAETVEEAEAGAQAGEAEVDSAGSLRDVVNPLGGGSNCVNCAVATDATVSGSPASALDSGPQPISALEDLYGGSFKEVSGPGEIGDLLQEAGPGARGIVYGARAAGQVGHVFNAINDGGEVSFLDGQTGSASFEGFSGLKFLFTNLP